ncbi:deoxyribonuclease [Halobacteriales archaeon QS_3_64_16]|nr:MAG: deoxyribonuclease [Halobacteriales archaeon QS_3_64_16]
MDCEQPILDDHLHLDPVNGDPSEAAADFADSGGTHLLVLNKPSWTLGIEVDERADFREGFDLTLDAAHTANEILPGQAWTVLGVHPGLISRLVDDRGYSPEAARELMQAGLEVAAEYVEQDRALALKSGRPHYPVSEDVWDASNAVLRHALSLAGDLGCVLQLHTEDTDDLSEVGEWAEDRGVSIENVVKHYASGPVTGATASVISRKEELRAATESDDAFLMETDFLDDPDRPGAVLGPKTVPRRVRWLREEGAEEVMWAAHVETPEQVYGIDTRAALDIE